jgi:GDPmannose 4,6-dehydratase
VLLGNPRKAQDVLGFSAETTLEQMMVEMVEADLERLRRSERQ